jgi:4-hydroxy-3-methylbut-2-en-1-yl diphosphate reductase
LNRSVERRRFAVRGTSPGEVIVGGFNHPARGRVRAPAAPVLAAELARLGFRIRVAREPIDPGTGPAGGVLFTASYLDHTGSPVGFAAAADATDPGALAAAAQTVRVWSGVWRTRRLLVADAGSCCAEAAACGDTCQLVAATHAELRRFTGYGDMVVVIGRRGHAAVPALVGQAPEQVVVVETVADVPALRVDPDRVAYVVQTGLPIEDAAPVVAALRARYPRIRGAHPDSLCYAASDRAQTIRAVAGSCDLMLVLGGTGAGELVGLAAASGVPVRVLGHTGELRADWLVGPACVGLAGSPSTRPGLAAEVIGVFSGLGPLSVAHRRVSTETTTGPLPVFDTERSESVA